jgi:hypothetical protein
MKQADCSGDVGEDVPAGSAADDARPAKPGGQWTPARLALLESDYATVGDTKELLGRLNALDGPPLTARAMRCQAWVIGVSTRANPRDRPYGRRPSTGGFVVPADLDQAEADPATIANWARAHGVPGNPPPLDAVNARRLQHGLPPFTPTRSWP